MGLSVRAMAPAPVEVSSPTNRPFGLPWRPAPAATAIDPLRSLLARVRRVLPRGRTLPVEEWRRRHRAMAWLLAAHFPVLAAYGTARGYGVVHSTLEAGIVALFAVLAALPTRGRKYRSSMVAIGLLTASAILVHMSTGVIEAHFHFFVVVVLLTLYEDWLPLLLAAGYVALHHGVGGALDPAAVYNHPDAIAHPWKWALIHAGFVFAAAAAAVMAWRLNEDVREETRAAYRKAHDAELRLEGSAQELAARARELERSNRDLEQFAYVASHDLSAPLRSVSSFVQLLRRRYDGKLDEDADDFIGFAVDGVHRMQALIDDLLRYSRVGSAQLELTPVDSGELLEEVVAVLGPRLKETRGQVVADGLPVVVADRSQLSQLFQNLVGNALKFTADRPPVVEVAARRKDDGYVFTVRDNGIGMEPSHAERVFAMFERLHPSDRYDGTGIGLAICKRVVERHGGEISVRSTPGEGTTFRFAIPDASPGTAAATADALAA